MLTAAEVEADIGKQDANNRKGEWARQRRWRALGTRSRLGRRWFVLQDKSFNLAMMSRILGGHVISHFWVIVVAFSLLAPLVV